MLVVQVSASAPRPQRQPPPGPTLPRTTQGPPTSHVAATGDRLPSSSAPSVRHVRPRSRPHRASANLTRYREAARGTPQPELVEGWLSIVDARHARTAPRSRYRPVRCPVKTVSEGLPHVFPAIDRGPDQPWTRLSIADPKPGSSIRRDHADAPPRFPTGVRRGGAAQQLHRRRRTRRLARLHQPVRAATPIACRERPCSSNAATTRSSPRPGTSTPAR